MARRRNRIKKKSFSIANKLFPLAKAVVPVVAFIEQISAKDRQTLGPAFSQRDTVTQGKILLNIITGRLAGFGIFHGNGLANTIPPQTLNPSGVINKWTMGGLAGIGYAVLGKGINNMSSNMGLGSLIPAVSKIKSLSKGAIAGGVIGGFFDDPVEKVGQPQQTMQSYPNLKSQSQPMLQISNMSSQSYSNGDSTSGGLS